MGKSTGGCLVMRASAARALPSLVVAAAVLVVPCRALGGGVVPDAPQAESPPVAKNRFISFVPGNAESQVALRVTFGSMSYLDRTGQVRWVGPPGDYYENCGPGASYRGAALQCAPFYMDWGGEELLHVTADNDEVLPGSVYAVQAIFQGDDVEDESNYSAPLIIFTAAKYADTVGWWNGVEWTPPDGVVSFHDVAAGVAKYFGVGTISHVRGKLTRCDLFYCTGFDAFSPALLTFQGYPETPLYLSCSADQCGQSPRFECGNGVLEPAEQCDDGNLVAGDGCDARCLFEPACGNGMLDPGEQCDDGGTMGGDGCDGACRFETQCGNGLREPGEDCDDGGTLPGDGCDENCQAEQAGAIVSLVPVGSSGGSVISGNEIALAERSERIFLEVHVSNWDPNLDGLPVVRTYQASIDPAGYESGLMGTVSPPVIPCSGEGVCVGGGNDGAPCEWSSQCDSYDCRDSACFGELGKDGYCFSATGTCKPRIDLDRADLLIDELRAVDARTPSYRYGLTEQGLQGTVDDGAEKYAGALVLDASEEALGTFTIGFKSGYAETFLLDDDNLPIPIAEIRPAVIRIESECCMPDGTCSSSPSCSSQCLGDCDNNGHDDLCDLIDGIASDCNGDGVLDACDPDCNSNGDSDVCDIAGGASDDCDGDGVPDECQSGDCQPNGIADHCDLADGTSEDCNFDAIPDECQPDEDCNTNGTKDICDIGAETSFDCNLNLTPDECDLVAGSLDDNGNAIPDECEEAPGPDPLPYPNTRALSIAPSGQHAITALRVRLVRMYNTDETDADNSVCGSRNAPLPDLSAFDGQIRWASPPQAYADEAVPPMADFVAAKLQCCPHFRDWSPAALAAEFPSAATDLLHLFGREIVPCSEYEVQAVSINCLDLADENCYSDVLTVRTPRFGDVWEPFSPGSVGQPNFSDINAEVQKYKGFAYDPDAYSGAPPKYRAMLHGNVPDLHGLVGFLDIAQCVNGFKGLAYPEQGPVDCAPCP